MSKKVNIEELQLTAKAANLRLEAEKAEEELRKCEARKEAERLEQETKRRQVQEFLDSLPLKCAEAAQKGLFQLTLRSSDLGMAGVDIGLEHDWQRKDPDKSRVWMIYHGILAMGLKVAFDGIKHWYVDNDTTEHESYNVEQVLVVSWAAQETLTGSANT